MANHRTRWRSRWRLLPPEFHGHDPKSASVWLFFALPQRALAGGRKAAGVQRGTVGVPSEPPDKVSARLDSYAALTNS